MSILGSQVYGNPSTPLWLSTAGGVITGNVTLDGALYTDQGVIAQFGGGKAGFQFQDLSGAETFRLASLGPSSPQNIIQSTVPLVFTQLGQANGNTQLVTSTVGSLADVLTVGGTMTARVVGAQNFSLATGPAGIGGTGTIAIGATNVVIATTAVTANSRIFVQHNGAPSAGPGAGAGQGGLTVSQAAIVPGTSFRVDLVDPATGISVAASAVAVTFSWIIVN
jgi:hypothetical protein